LTKSFDQRTFQEPIDRKVQFLPFLDGSLTDTPLVVVDAIDAIAEMLGTDRIQGARNRLHKLRLSLTISSFQGAKTTILDGMSIVHVLQVLIASKDTILAVHDTRHQVALDVCVSHTLFVDDRLGRSRKVVPYGIQRVLYLHDFIHGDRSPRISLYATLALASIQVTAKFLGDNVR